ncbi:MAG: hypothetical protein R3F49_13135 [Planctomycetota bacterium]
MSRAAQRKAALAGLSSADGAARASAAIQLADAGERSALPAIEALARDHDRLVRGAAAFARWRLTGAVGDLEPLLTLVCARDEEAVQLGAMGLARMGDSVVPELARVAADASTSAWRRRRVLRVLAEIEGEPARAALRLAAQSKDAALAKAARRALDRTDD